MTRTIVESKTKTAIIGFDQPFCVIGERINPTGRKILAEELERGDFSRVKIRELHIDGAVCLKTEGCAQEPDGRPDAGTGGDQTAVDAQFFTQPSGMQRGSTAKGDHRVFA